MPLPSFPLIHICALPFFSSPSTCELLIQLPLKPAELFGDGSPTAFALQLSLKAVWSTVAGEDVCGLVCWG